VTPWIIVGSIGVVIGYSIFLFLQGKKAGAKGEKAKWLQQYNEGQDAFAGEMVKVNKRAKDREDKVRADSGRDFNPFDDVLDMSSLKTPSTRDTD